MPTRARTLSPPDLTDKDVDDASHVGPMLDQLSRAPTSFIGDGAYDRGAVSELLARRNPDMSVLVPPCKGAVPGSDGAMSSPTQRDRHILEIEERGRMHWQKASGYNRRSKVEASIGRYKRVIGDASESHALTIAAKRKWRLPSKRSIGCVSSVRRSSFASHDHEAKGRMPSPRASMQQGYVYWQADSEVANWRVSLGPDQPFAPPVPTWREHLRSLGHPLETDDEIERACRKYDLPVDDLRHPP